MSVLRVEGDGVDTVVHEEEATPLHTDLNYTQYSRCAWKATDFLATAHIPCALRQRQDVRDAGSTGYRSK